MDRIDPSQLSVLVRAFLAEDIGRGDHTTQATVEPGARGRGWIEAREPGVVAGLEVARVCFLNTTGGDLDWSADVSDGDEVESSRIVATFEGALAGILTGERVALNLLGRLSGIATLTRRFVTAIEGTTARIVDTRKTTPGLRLLEKYAVRTGGGYNHRFGLDDGILVKDNHIVAAGGVAHATRRAKDGVPHGLLVEVEVSDLDQLEDALSGGADAVLLDNMTPDQVREAVTRAGGKVLLEASGGISLDNVREFAEAGVELISVGALTHSARSMDVSLELEHS